MANSKFTIGEVARRAGVRTSTLRFYEDAGLLTPPERVSGSRRYDPDALRQLRAIQMAQDAGFTLSEIKTLLHGFDEGTPASARWRELAQRKLVEVEQLIAKAQGMKRLLEAGLSCDCLTPDECSLLATWESTSEGRDRVS